MQERRAGLGRTVERGPREPPAPGVIPGLRASMEALGATRDNQGPQALLVGGPVQLLDELCTIFIERTSISLNSGFVRACRSGASGKLSFLCNLAVDDATQFSSTCMRSPFQFSSNLFCPPRSVRGASGGHWLHRAPGPHRKYRKHRAGGLQWSHGVYGTPGPVGKHGRHRVDRVHRYCCSDTPRTHTHTHTQFIL